MQQDGPLLTAALQKAESPRGRGEEKRKTGRMEPQSPQLRHSTSQEGLRVKNFKLGEVLGKGSAGCVYKSLNMDTGDVVAIKQIPLRHIPKDDIGRIMREIHLLNHLDHDNIVKYIDSIKSKDHLYIVLEFVENGSLASTVKRFGSLLESLIAIYIEQVHPRPPTSISL